MSRGAMRAGLAVSGLVLLVLLWQGATGVAAKATEADLAKVKVGMDRAEVLDIMGKPDRDQAVREEEELCRLYVYKNVGRYKIVNIWFDCSDKVHSIDKVG